MIVSSQEHRGWSRETKEIAQGVRTKNGFEPHQRLLLLAPELPRHSLLPSTLHSEEYGIGIGGSFIACERAGQPGVGQQRSLLKERPRLSSVLRRQQFGRKLAQRAARDTRGLSRVTAPALPPYPYLSGARIGAEKDQQSPRVRPK